MTDIPSQISSVPARLGVTARFEDGSLELDLVPRPEVLHHGIVRASVISYVVDALAGISVDGAAGVWTLTTDMSIRMRPVPAPESLSAVRSALEEAGFAVEAAELTMVPKTTVEVADESAAKKILRLIDQLEDNDDVQDVYANFDIPERVLEAVAG